MAKTKVQALGVTVSRQLGDPNNDSFTLLDDIYPALEEADKAVLNYRPDANSNTQVVDLVAGTRQTLPTGALRLIDVVCMMDAAGTVEERDITMWPDDQQLPPHWRQLTQVADVEHFMYDDRNPLEWENYPPCLATKDVKIITSDEFAAYGTIDANTESHLPQSYDSAKIEYALYRCLSRDNSPLRERADIHFTKFLQLLGVKTGRDAAASPNAQRQ